MCMSLHRPCACICVGDLCKIFANAFQWQTVQLHKHNTHSYSHARMHRDGDDSSEQHIRANETDSAANKKMCVFNNRTEFKCAKLTCSYFIRFYANWRTEHVVILAADGRKQSIHGHKWKCTGGCTWSRVNVRCVPWTPAKFQSALKFICSLRFFSQSSSHSLIPFPIITQPQFTNAFARRIVKSMGSNQQMSIAMCIAYMCTVDGLLKWLFILGENASPFRRFTLEPNLFWTITIISYNWTAVRDLPPK